MYYFVTVILLFSCDSAVGVTDLVCHLKFLTLKCLPTSNYAHGVVYIEYKTKITIIRFWLCVLGSRAGVTKSMFGPTCCAAICITHLI